MGELLLHTSIGKTVETNSSLKFKMQTSPIVLPKNKSCHANISFDYKEVNYFNNRSE